MPKNTSSYQTLSNQLEEVVAKLQSPDVGIDDAVQLFEKALQLTKQMEQHLQEAENRVSELRAKFGGEA